MEESIEFLKWYSTSEENHTFEDIVSFARMNAKEEGEASGRKEAARNMLKKNMSISDIKDVTGLTKKEIKKLQKELNF